MTILVADNIASVGMEDLRDAGHTYVVELTLSSDALHTERPDAMIVRSTR